MTDTPRTTPIVRVVFFAATDPEGAFYADHIVDDVDPDRDLDPTTNLEESVARARHFVEASIDGDATCRGTVRWHGETAIDSQTGDKLALIVVG